jgi:hypothetical protein
MNEQQIVWTWISDFLFNQNIYPNPAHILNAYPVGTPLTPDSNFVIITRMGIHLGYLPEITFNVPNQNVDIQNQLEITYQVDFYGTNAQRGANAFQMYLLSANSSNYLSDYGYGVGTVEDVVQSTNPIDRDTYVGKFICRFTLLTINNVLISQDGLTPDDIIVTLEPELN